MASYVLPVTSKSIWDFDPRSIGGCTLWLDSDDQNTLFTDISGTVRATIGQTVSRWNDKSISANHATRNTVSGSRPIVGARYTTDSISSRGQLSFGYTNVVITGISGTFYNVTSDLTLTTGQTLVVHVLFQTTGYTLNLSGGFTYYIVALTGTLPFLSIQLSISPGGAAQTPSGSVGSGVLPAAMIDGALYNLNSFAFPLGISDGTYFFVAKQGFGAASAFSGNYTSLQIFNYGVWGGGQARQFAFTGGSSYSFSLVNTGNVNYTMTSAQVAQNSIVTSSLNNSILSSFINGSSNGLVDMQRASPFFNTVSGGAQIGEFIGNTPYNNIGLGTISEIIVFNRSLTHPERQAVEGYLAWKWNLQTSLPTSHPFFNSNYATSQNPVRPLLRNFIPTDLDNCFMWHDGADVSSMTLSGNNIGTWRDKSGNGNDLTQATDSKRPVLTTTSNNPTGRDILFTNTGSTTFIVKQNIVVNSPTYSQFVVWRNISGGSQTPSNYFARIFSAATTLDNSSFLDPTTMQVQFAGYTSYNGYRGGNSVGINGSPYTNTDVYHILSYIVNPGGTVSVYFDGQLRGTITPLYSNNVTFTNFALGSTISGSQTINGYVNEGIGYTSALNDGDRQKVEGYLAWKWGIQRVAAIVNIPTSHSYYRFPPPSLATPGIPTTTALFNKAPFNPADLSPTLWMDSSDATTYSLSGTRISSWTSKGSQAVTFAPPAITGISGPLLARSSRGTGVGLPYMDFFNGGTFNISGMASATYNPSGTILTVSGIAISATHLNFTSNPSVSLSINQPIVLTAGSISGLTLGTTYFVRSLLGNLVPGSATPAHPTTSMTISASSGGGNLTGLSLSGGGPWQFTAGTYAYTFTTLSGHAIPNGAPVAVVLEASTTTGGTSIAGSYFGNVSGTTNTTIGFPLTNANTNMSGTQILTGGRIEYGNMSISSGTVSGSTIVFTTTTPHNLTTGNNVNLNFHGPSLPSQTAPYTAATVSGVANLNISGSITGTTLTVSGSGAPPIGSYLFYNSTTPGNYIVSGSNPTYTVSISGTVALTNIVCSSWTVALTLSGSGVSGDKIRYAPLAFSNNFSVHSLTSYSGALFTFGALANVPPTTTAGAPVYFPAAVGNVAANTTLFIKTVAGLTLTLSSTRALTDTISGGSFSGAQDVFIYTQINKITSPGTSTIAGLNGLLGWMNSISGNIITLGGMYNGTTPVALPTTGAVNMALVQNPSVLPNGLSTGFSGSYLFGSNAVTVIDPRTFSIPWTPQTYAGYTYNGPILNVGASDFTLAATTYGFTINTGITQAMAQFPGNGYLLDATTNIAGCFGTTTTTVVIVAHFNNTSMRQPTGNVIFQPTMLSCSLSGAGFSAGNSPADFALQLNGGSQTTQIGLRHNGQRTISFVSDNSTFTQPFGGISGGYRIITTLLNGTASAVGDLAANSKWVAVHGWRNDGSSGVFAYNPSFNPSGAITTGTALAPTLMRLGGDTAITSISGSATSYYDNGIAEVLVFNTALTLEQRQLVEGYLAQKYACQATLALGSNALSTTSFIHPYRLSATTPSLALTPTNTYMQGLVAWFDASNASTVTLSGTTVSSWASGGGFISGLTLAQATQANRPTLVANALNGLPGVRFVTGTISGSNYPNSSNLTSTLQTYPLNQFTTLSSNIEYTYFTVLKFITTPTQNASVINVVSSSNSYILLKNDRNSVQNSGTTSQNNFYSPSLTISTPYIIVSTRRGNVLRNIVIGNGARNIASTTFSNLPSTDRGSDYRLTMSGYGTTPANNNDPYGGDIYEHMMFRYALTDSQIFQIEGYLAWKWGLQNSLPSTHPYYRVRY